MRLSLILLCLLMCSQSHALEIDEKLPLRILKTSKSQKTILINRGLEDGLENGNHAKFFLTKGVVARGVMVKSSPTRSVWAIYRVIDGAAVREGKVMNLKISTPLKLTEDPTKMLSDEDLPEYNTGAIKYYNNTTIPYYQGRVAPVYKGEPVPEYYNEGIPVVRSDDGEGKSQIEKVGSDEDLDKEFAEFLDESSSDKKQSEEDEFKDLEEELAKDEQKEDSSQPDEQKSAQNSQTEKSSRDSEQTLLENLEQEQVSNIWQNKVWEVNATLYMNSLDTTVSGRGNETDTDFSGEFSLSNVALGVERYFYTTKWYSHTSLGVFFHRGSLTSFDPVGIEQESVTTSFGASASYHLISPFRAKELIPYVTTSLGFGTVEDTAQATSVTSGAEQGRSDSGQLYFYSIGGGVKYNFLRGYGGRAVIDYFASSQNFQFDDSIDTDKTISGLRFALSVSYRF